MKRASAICIGLFAAILAWDSAAAADLSPRYQQPIARAPACYAGYNWTGFYLGINGGGGWGRSQWDGVDRFDVSGGLIGGTIGYKWQFGQGASGAAGGTARTRVQ